MARVTVEDCLEHVDNRFSLVHLSAKRVRQLREGAKPYLESRNKDIVLSLREIAAGTVYPVSAREAEEALAQAEAREREKLAQAFAQSEVTGVARIAARLQEIDEEGDI